MRLIDADALEELFREVIGGIAKKPEINGNLEHMVRASAMVIEMIKDAPTIEPTLYGYKIEHLALIARVMQKEGVSPEKAVQTFVDMKRIIEMLIDEIQEKVEMTKMEVEHERD